MAFPLGKLCKKYNNISFDLFDTLIRRVTALPRDVFELTEKEYNRLHGSGIQDFRLVRAECERTARSRSSREVTLDDIYSVMAEKYENTDEYKAIEIRTELDICFPDRKMTELFSECVREGKNVFIITDMYLPEDIITELMNKNGITGYRRLYLSSSCGSRKADGSLFREVLEKEGIAPGELLHIGDNLRSDFINAEKLGIRAFHLKKNEHLPSYENDRECTGDMLYRFISCTSQAEDVFSKIGYCGFGPLLFGFVNWLREKCITEKHNDLVFLSRDGYLMKKAFDMINDCGVTTHYFYASRRALHSASINLAPDFDSVMNTMFLPRVFSLGWLMGRWGLSADDYRESLSASGISPDEKLSGRAVMNDERIRRLYDSLKNDIISNSLSEYRAFENYIKQTDISGNTAIVDIGWFGNMQNSLETMLSHMNTDAHISGYYLGIVPQSEYQNVYSIHGYLFDKEHNSGLYERFRYLNSLMELFFMAPHGSAEKYTERNGNPFPQLSVFEYEGTPTFEAVSVIQSNALKFIEKYAAIAKYTDYPETVFLSPLYNMLMAPDLRTAEALGDLEIWDEGASAVAPKEKTPVILPLKANAEKLLSAHWKTGYLKRNIMLPVRYDRILFSLRKIYKSIRR